MKTITRVMLGLSVAALCVSGCAERPGKKKEDKKESGDAKDKGDDAKKKGEKKDEKKKG
ncbi:MAG: hypothetical protein AAF799_09260 [Myxococcota bacterium]